MHRIIHALLIVAFALSLASCRVSDEPELTRDPIEQGTFEMGFQDGVIIRMKGLNLFTISTDYPDISVSSSFGNVTEEPLIKYMGQHDSLTAIPININEFAGNRVTEIIDNGGYIVRMSVYDPSEKSDGPLFVRMRIRENKGATQKESSLLFEYQIYAVRTNLTWKLPF